jgi:hypothetical protein
LRPYAVAGDDQRIATVELGGQNMGRADINKPVCAQRSLLSEPMVLVEVLMAVE